MQLSPAARAVRERLFTDFEFYAQNALWIRTKDQKVVPFKLNKAQKLLLNAVMDQPTPRVRAPDHPEGAPDGQLDVRRGVSLLVGLAAQGPSVPSWWRTTRRWRARSSG
jgi:hypothetical protein